MKVHVFFICLAYLVIAIQSAAIQNQLGEVEDGVTDDKKKCPPWGKWESSKCLWPSQAFSSLPKSCTSLPKKPEIPDIIKQFVQSKQIEVYSLVQNLFKLRGAQSACGYCSRKIQCRQTKGGEWKQGCPFIQAKIVNEECEGTDACVIKPILGACPPPVPMPPPRRRPKPHGQDSMGDLQSIDANKLGDQNLDIGVEKNATQGPPLWHCARNKKGDQCLCCCGWYLPDAKTGKCVNIRKDDDETADDQTWDWSGLMDLDLNFETPFGLDRAIGDGMTQQIEAPPMGGEPVEEAVETDDNEMPNQMPPPDQPQPPAAEPPAVQPVDATVHQVVAPVTDTNRIQKKPLHETNEI